MHVSCEAIRKAPRHNFWLVLCPTVCAHCRSTRNGNNNLQPSLQLPNPEPKQPGTSHFTSCTYTRLETSRTRQYNCLSPTVGACKPCHSAALASRSLCITVATRPSHHCANGFKPQCFLCQTGSFRRPLLTPASLMLGCAIFQPIGYVLLNDLPAAFCKYFSQSDFICQCGMLQE